MKKEAQAAQHAGYMAPRNDAEGAKLLEAREDADPSVTAMMIHVMGQFLAEQAAS